MTRRSARPGEVSIGRGMPSGEDPWARSASPARWRSPREPGAVDPAAMPRRVAFSGPGEPGLTRHARPRRRPSLGIGHERASARPQGRSDRQADRPRGSPDRVEGPASEQRSDPSAHPDPSGHRSGDRRRRRSRPPPARRAGRRAARSIGPARRGRSRVRRMRDGRTIVRCRMRPASVATSDSATSAAMTAPTGEVANRLSRRGRDERSRRRAGSGARRAPGRSDLGTHDPKGPPGRSGERPLSGGRGADSALTRGSTARRRARESDRASGAGHRQSRDRARRSGRRSPDARGRAARTPARLPTRPGVGGQSSSNLSL